MCFQNRAGTTRVPVRPGAAQQHGYKVGGCNPYNGDMQQKLDFFDLSNKNDGFNKENSDLWAIHPLDLT